ncbi:PTS system permease (IIAMan), nitrogen regulatory IIA protein [Liberibacter crescens BT-1]|uniref:PTS system permease (IIAMan), nitrogen regulatory IIA protein n=1 Tax=Liberibacter crescens (strain BT-1) TaxID=1215343 RepID=L0EY90_LIBCB|nr:PTS sugar transporter subunit IIA [Liberibacter crescens]AGA65351.1 PTS system permease (IIAMan), nitrogen regulatory IIA protein [Liberibacter crescens BT-1]AMC12291.1 PTS fructose transporter subunit IIA [Liberibacter crescens]
MIGLVLVTHGNIAEAFSIAVEHIVGPQRLIETISINPADDLERCRQDMIKSIENVDEGKGVIILTDMFGGTPSNLSISVMKPGYIEVIAGINLPMLIKLIGVRGDNDIQKALNEAANAGRKYINVASQLLLSK